jgi:hypothetical protein
VVPGWRFSGDVTFTGAAMTFSRHPPQQQSPAHWVLMVWALAVCVSVLSLYVQVLHQQVEQGRQFHQAQRAGTAMRSAEAHAPGKPVVVSANLY